MCVIPKPKRAACQQGRAINIHFDSLLSNRGRTDGKQLGAASTTLYHEEREYGHCEQVFGESLTTSDAMFAPSPPLSTCSRLS